MIGIAILLVGGSVVIAKQAEERNNEGVVIEENVIGNPDSSVVLVEYSDFQCPACADFHPIVKEVLAEHGDQIRFEYRHFPLMQIHPHAEAAARAAEAAGQQDKFFEFHDILFERQEEWSRATQPSAYFVQYAEELGLDTDQFGRQMRSTIIRDHVRAQFEEARAAGFTGTPSFVLNGQPMKLETYDDFRAQVAAAVNPTVDTSIITAPTSTPTTTLPTGSAATASPAAE